MLELWSSNKVTDPGVRESMIYMVYMSNKHIVYLMANKIGMGPKAQGIFKHAQHVKKWARFILGHFRLRTSYEVLCQRPKFDNLFLCYLCCIVSTNFVLSYGLI